MKAQFNKKLILMIPCKQQTKHLQHFLLPLPLVVLTFAVIGLVSFSQLQLTIVQ